MRNRTAFQGERAASVALSVQSTASSRLRLGSVENYFVPVRQHVSVNMSLAKWSHCFFLKLLRVLDLPNATLAAMIQRHATGHVHCHRWVGDAVTGTATRSRYGMAHNCSTEPTNSSGLPFLATSDFHRYAGA